MEVAIRPAAPEDVGAVLAELSPRMEQELPLLYPGLDPAERRLVIVRQALGAILAGRASAFLADGRPACVLSWTADRLGDDRTGAGRWWVTTLATEAFYAPAFLRPARRHLDAVQGRLGGALAAHTRSDHARARPWLRFLGFRPDPLAEPSCHVRPAPAGRTSRGA